MASRKFKYNERLHKIAEAWIQENGLQHYGGATLKEYCNALGIHVTSHYNWLERFPQYKKMVEESIEHYRVSNTKKLYNALLDSALGGYRENEVEDTEFKPNPENPNKPMIAKKKTHREKRYVKGDTAAAIFLISNLSPECFINRQRSDVTIKDTQVRELSMDEAQEFLRKLEEEY